MRNPIQIGFFQGPKETQLHIFQGYQLYLNFRFSAQKRHCTLIKL